MTETSSSIVVYPRIPVVIRDPLIPGQEPKEHSTDVQGIACRSRLPPVNDRLSAVPFSGMVRDQNTPENFFLSNNEETRGNKRASSIGATFRRLFSKSPAPQYERSSSEPKNVNSPQVSIDSVQSSTLPPNNPYFVPTEQQRANLKQYRGE